jgi:hypothetical protein
LSDALDVAIMMCLTFQQDIMNHVIPNNMIDDYVLLVGIQLLNWWYCNEYQKVNVFYPHLNFLWNFEPKRVHNMLALMLDPSYTLLQIMGLVHQIVSLRHL